MTSFTAISALVAAHPRIVLALVLLTLLAFALAAGAPDGFPCTSTTGC